MSITVLLQKTRASYVPWFNFLGPFFDKKFGLQIANVQIILIFAKNNDFSIKRLRATVFNVEGCAFDF